MKVSIIIPIYNVAPYVEACLQSVFNQTYQNIEVLLVDDCGTDNSMDIVTNLIKGYDGNFEIKILHHPQNKGLSAARNTGIKAASGEYIYFLDSDDTIPHDAINNLAKKVSEHPNVSFVIGNIQTIGYKTYHYPLLSKEYINNNNDIMADYLQFKWNVMACNKLINKKFFILHNLYFTEGIYHEDLDFSFKLAYYAKDMACCYDITYYYLIRQNSITTQKKLKNFIDNLHIINNNFGLIDAKGDDQYNKRLISNYTIITIYNILIDIIKNKNRNISTQDKNELIKQAKNILETYKGYNDYDMVNFFRKKIIFLPTIILKTIIPIYCMIRKIH